MRVVGTPSCRAYGALMTGAVTIILGLAYIAGFILFMLYQDSLPRW